MQCRIYGNENEVGQGIKDSGVPREEIFITSKLWNTHHPNAKEGLQQTLDALGTDYLDLYVGLTEINISYHRLTRKIS
jgi:glycerol 2-dehydrogenase (NADP+)